jgi:hypothetical protein
VLLSAHVRLAQVSGAGVSVVNWVKETVESKEGGDVELKKRQMTRRWPEKHTSAPLTRWIVLRCVRGRSITSTESVRVACLEWLLRNGRCPGPDAEGDGREHGYVEDGKTSMPG